MRATRSKIWRVGKMVGNVNNKGPELALPV